jgi:predicted O-methyltransferase YrrM
MRTIAHWTPRYLYDRARLFAHERTNPDLPWLTRDAVASLQTLLKASDRGVEFGSGRSTVWLASRVAHLKSVEHNPGWFDSVSQKIASQSIDNVDYLKADADESKKRGEDEYVDCLVQAATQSVDFVLVDAIFRRRCVEEAIPKLKKGGLLIIDNVDRYIRHEKSTSPNARSLRRRRNIDAKWQELSVFLSSWRSLWTSNGVTDTAIFIKPCAG